MDFLQNLGIETSSTSIDKLKKECLEVFETPSLIQSPMSGQLIEDGFHTILNENGNVHGKVSNKGSVLQNAELIDIAYQIDLDHDLGLNFKKANINYFKDESVSTLNIPLDVVSFKTKAGFDDVTEVSLFIKNGFGGNSCTEIGVYSHRFVCANGMEIRHGLNFFKSKHTELMNSKAKTFLHSKLPTMINSAVGFKQNALRFDAKAITKEDILNFEKSFFNYKDVQGISTKKKNQIDAFKISLNEELTRVGYTVWGLLQSATNYTNNTHYQANKENKEFVVVGSGAKLNEHAEKYCLDLVK